MASCSAWVLFLLFAGSLPASGQTISHEDFLSVIPFLQKEDYRGRAVVCRIYVEGAFIREYQPQ
jgi:hypothetical protein